jgi:hypothetical protein
MRQVMMWIIGRAVPQTPVLAPFIRIGVLGFVAAIAGGLLFTLGCVGLLVSLYLWIESRGLEPALALLIVSGVTFLLAGIIVFATQRFVKKRVGAINGVLAAAPTLQIDDSMIEIPKAILTGFLEGIVGERNGSDRTRSN